MKRFLGTCASLVVAFGAGGRAGAAETFQPLKDVRPKLAFPSYTPAEKTLLVDQALRLTRDLYVHRDLKVRDFGPDVDPVPRLEALRDVAAGMAPKALNDALTQVFLDQRDLHYNFYYPKRIACWTALLPVGFTEARVDGDRAALLVASLPRIGDVAVDGLAQAQVGDEVLAYDGRTPNEAIRALEPLGSGANPGASRARAIQLLSLRGFARRPIPDRDTVSLVLQRPNGERYALELPWIARGQCEDESARKGPHDPLPRPRFDEGNDPDALLYNRVYARYDRRVVGKRAGTEGIGPLTPTAEPALSWAKVATAKGRFGFLRLDSFVPAKLDSDAVIALVRDLVARNFAGLDGIIIDVRDNGGGWISFGEQLVQLFTPKDVQPNGFRMLATEANAYLVAKSNIATDPAWQDAVRQARDGGEAFTRPLPLTSGLRANRLGQAWFKPVVVLTNGNCYSTCDMFTASMQDHAAAVIVGEHPATGAGGANVVSHSAFLASLEGASDVPFVSLPHGHDMRVAWRQTVRHGINEGILLEDAGVKADVVRVPRAADLFNGEALLLDDLATIMRRMAPRHTASPDPDFTREQVLANGQDAAWQGRVVGTDVVEARVNGSIVRRAVVAKGKDAGTVAFALAGAGRAWARENVELVGYREGQRAWRVWRPLRWVGAYRALTRGETWDVPIEAPFPRTLQLENESSAAHDGWRVEGDALVVGDGTRYVDDVTTRFYAPLDFGAVADATLTFQADVHTEKGFDFLTVFGRIPDTGETIPLGQWSGDVTGAQSLSLAPLAGKARVDLVFAFTSDSGVTGPGVAVRDVRVSVAE